MRWRLTHPTQVQQVIQSRAALSSLSPLLVAQLSQHSTWHGWAGRSASAPIVVQKPVQHHPVAVRPVRTIRVAALQARSTQWAGSTTATFYLTGYVASGSRTATGTWPHWGTIAVDPRVIPLGTTVYIDGLGYFRAEDTGGGVIGRHIDVFCTSVSQAYGLTGYRAVTYTP